MIENALVEGARIRWQKPNTVPGTQDGTIVPSVNTANPMTYLGSTQPQPRGGLFRRAPRVYQMPVNSPIPHSWLDYITGRTARVVQGSDVVTGFMSGCLIARATWNGGMSVFHLGTVENPVATNLVKVAFRTQLPVNATGFYPHAAWSVAERTATGKATDILALVTSAGTFYSILLCHGNNEYTVGGIKKVPPMNRVLLMASLL
jgi:hypothetical protein